jgi:hypothetical protein
VVSNDNETELWLAINRGDLATATRLLSAQLDKHVVGLAAAEGISLEEWGRRAYEEASIQSQAIVIQGGRRD